MLTKKRLAILLSKLKDFEDPDPKKEQYITDSEVAAGILWNAHMLGEIEDRMIADLGCGTGILGIGALILGARWVHFLDNDPEAIRIAEVNLAEFDSQDYHFIEADVRDFNRKVDVIIQNPPFGVQEKHADRVFLEQAFKYAPIIYSIHMYETLDFLIKFAEDNGFKITHKWRYNLPLKSTMVHHRKRIHIVHVGCFRFQKI